MGANTKGALIALAAFAAFAVHDVIVKYLGASYSTFQILFFSVAFGFPLITLMLVTDTKPATLRPRRPFWTGLRTVAVVITGLCAFYAFAVLPLAQTYAILFAMPLLITLLAIPVLGERVGLHRGAAVVVGLLGVLIVLRPGSAPLGPGHAAALVAAVGGATVSIVTRKIGREERDAVLLLFPMLANFVVMGAFLPGSYTPVALSDLGLMALLAALAFGAMLLLIAAYRHGEAAIVAPMQYSQILWAALFGAVFFDESIDLFTGLGASVVIASGVYIVWRERQKGPASGTPVLNTRSRVTAGGYMRLGALTRRARD